MVSAGRLTQGQMDTLIAAHARGEAGAVKRFLPGFLMGAGIGTVSMTLFWVVVRNFLRWIGYAFDGHFGVPVDPGLVSSVRAVVYLGTALYLVGFVVAAWTAARRSGFLAVPVAALLAYGLSFVLIYVFAPLFDPDLGRAASGLFFPALPVLPLR